MRGSLFRALGSVHQCNDEFSETTMSTLMDVKFRPLLTVFVLTAIATTVALLFPPARELLPLAILLDLVPFGGVVAASVIATIRLRRVPLPLIRLLISVYGYFAGALIGTLGLAHLVAV